MRQALMLGAAAIVLAACGATDRSTPDTAQVEATSSQAETVTSGARS